VGSKELARVKEFSKHKLQSFRKDAGSIFSPVNFIHSLRKLYDNALTESQVAAKHHIVSPFKIKIVRDEMILSNKRKIIDGIIIEVIADISTYT